MPYLLALVAALVAIPAVGLGLVAVVLAVLAAVAVFACAVALGATGTVMDWILALTAMGLSWPAVRAWRGAVRRLRKAVATVGPGIGRLRGG